MSLAQCPGAKNIWLIHGLQKDGSQTIIGKLLMYVDDVLAVSWVLCPKCLLLLLSHVYVEKLSVAAELDSVGSCVWTDLEIILVDDFYVVVLKMLTLLCTCVCS